MATVPKLRLLSCLMTSMFLMFYIICFMVQKNIWSNQIVTVEKQRIFQLQNISDCMCSRRWIYPPIIDLDSSPSMFNKNDSHFKRLNSSCSDEGTHYQTNQNVITFSMYYSENPLNTTRKSFQTSSLNYQKGLLQNLLMMRQHYPGFSLRVYTSVNLHPGGYFCELLCKNEDLFWCDIRKTPSHGNLSGMNFRTWRFLTMGDPTVKIFHSRDLDSLIGHRDAAAAQDWLANGKDHKAIMLMRDHATGHNIPILAGMWSADNIKLLENGKQLQNRVILESQLTSSTAKSFDQKFLNKEIFYPLASNILAYDSYTCERWSSFTEVRPFPVQQKFPATGFVGNIINFSDNGKPKSFKVVECPIKCRPSYGLDWIYC